MYIYGEFSTLVLREKELIDDAKSVVFQSMLRSVEQFVVNAAPNVPIDTGMARGSFLNVLHLLRLNGIETNVDIPTRPQRVAKSRRALRYYHYDGRIFPKTPFSARKISTKPKDILKWNGNNLVFTFESNVKHLNINDVKRGWLSFQTGKDAFIRSLEFEQLQGSYIQLSESLITIGR